MSTLSQFFGTEENRTPLCGFQLTGSSTNQPQVAFSNSIGNQQVRIAYDTSNQYLSPFAIAGATLYFIQSDELLTLGTGVLQNNTATVTVYLDRLKKADRFFFFNEVNNTSWNKGTSSGTSDLESINEIGLRCRFVNTSNTFRCFNSFPNLTTLKTFYLADGTSANNIYIDFSGCAWDASSIEAILVGTDNGTVSKTSGTQQLQLNGGTASGLSQLTAAASAARSSLISKGWTVTLNA